MKMPIFAILARFWPVIGLFWPWYHFPKFSRSIFDLVLTGLSDIGKKILNSNDLLNENADLGYFRPFWACFWPVIVPISVSKARKDYVWLNSDRMKYDWPKNFKQLWYSWKKYCFWRFWAIFSLFLAIYTLHTATRFLWIVYSFQFLLDSSKKLD